MKNPLVSIIIPTYNRYIYIGGTLESVLTQTYSNWECIVVDDGSIDYTEELAGFYTEKDSRITFFCRPKDKIKGAAACRNYGLEKATGEFIQFLDSDDILNPGKLEHQIVLVKNKGRDTIFTCKWGYFNEVRNLNSRFKYKQKVYRDFRKPYRLLYYFGKHKEFFPLHVFLIPKNVIIDSGGWNEELTNNDDAEFMTRVLLKSKRISFVEDSIVYYRIGNGAKLSDFYTKSQAKSAITSLDLIAKNLAPKHPKTSKVYLKHLKKIIDQSILLNFPELAKSLNNKF